MYTTEEGEPDREPDHVLCIQLQCAFPGSRKPLVLGLVPQRTAPGGGGWEGGKGKGEGGDPGSGAAGDGHSPCQALIPSTVE